MPRRPRWFSPLVPIGLALALTLPFFPWGTGGLLAAPGRNGTGPRAANAGRTLVVAPNGSDTTGDGSASRPWKTIQKAASQVQPGDLVSINAGTYGGPITIDRGGTAAAPIVFRANGAVTVEGSGGSRDAIFVTYA